MSRNMDIEFPGARGFGFIRRVARANEAEFLKKARADDMPDFAIKEFAPHNGERYIIQYLEPAGRNRPAIGLDLASAEPRRNAAQQAMASGTATLTPPVTLVQASGLPLRSFVLLLPVYDLTMPLDSEKQRIAATLGWTFAPMVIDDVLERAGAKTGQIALQIADVSVNPNQPPFYSPPDFTDLENVAHQAQFKRTIFGRTWEFKLRAEPAFYANHEKLSPVWLASFTTICSFLLSFLLYFYLKSQQQLLAKSLRQMRLAALVESAHDAIISLDLNCTVTSWNNAAYLMFDYTASEAIGKKVYELIVPDEILPQKEAIVSKIKRGEFIPRHDTIRKTRDGRLIDVSVMFSPIIDKDKRVIGTAKTIIDIGKQKQLQLELHNTLGRLKMAVDSMNLGVWVWQMTDNQLIWDKRMFELYDAPESMQETGVDYEFWHSRLHPDDVGYVEKKIFGQVAGTDIYDPEFRIVLNNGEIRYLKAAAILERDPQGHAKQMVGVNFDITEHKANEQRLRESERRFRELFEYSPIAYQSLDIQGRFLDVNSRFCELLGYSREELLGKGFDEIWQEETKVGFPPEFSKFKHNLKISNELRLQRKDGQIVTVILEGRIQRDSQGQFIRTHCILTDISARKQAEQALLQLTQELEDKVQERTKELLTLYHQAPCGYHSLDVNGTIIQVNQTELDLLGYSREEYVGHSITEFLTPDSAKLFQRNFPEFCRTGRVRDVEFDLICKDGGILPFLVNADLVRDAQGHAL
jgi:PAS domain S-box-containing protein